MFTKTEQKTINEARKEFAKEQKNKSKAVSFLGYVYSESGLHCAGNTACHASMSSEVSYFKRADSARKGKLLVILSARQDAHEGVQATREQEVDFANWMIKDSPWATCFLNPDGDDVYDNHWMLNPLVTGNLLASAGIATRLPSEFVGRFRVWHRMFKLGVCPRKAYIFSLFFSSPHNSKKTYPITMSRASGHITFDTYTIKQSYQKFLDGDYTDRLKPYADCKTYDRINAGWSDTSIKEGDITKNWDRIRPPVGKKVVELNIFYKAPVDKYGFKDDAELLYLANELERSFQ